MSLDLNDLLRFQIKRNITNLYKNYLTMLEDLQEQHDTAFAKLKRSRPEDKDLICQAELLDQKKMEYLRKKVLDLGNNCYREIGTELEKFNVNVNIR
jgi:hypothetical protein